MAVSGLQHRAVGLVEIIPPGARGRFDGTYPGQDTARCHDASPLGTLGEQPVRDLMVAEARRVPLGRALAAGS